MVYIAPFKGIRPPAELAGKVASLPYDVVNSKEASQLAQKNPVSYFRIDKAEIDLPDINPYDSAVYEQAAKNLKLFLEKGWLIQDEQALYYLYELTMNGKTQIGVVCCASIEDYTSGKIKKHELTRPEKEVDRIQHILACDANTSPIFLTYRPVETIGSLLTSWRSNHLPQVDFNSYHEVRHKVWPIDDVTVIHALTQAFQEVPALYIADGHHRTESAVKVGLRKQQNGQASTESDRFLAILFPADELTILEYNRVVNVDIPEDFFEKLANNFSVEPVSEKTPQKKGSFHFYFDHQWYSAAIKPEKVSANAVDSLDVSYLQNHILAPIFGIEDIRTDQRIDFVGGIRPVEELERLVDSGEWKIAFSMYPTAMEDLLQVADSGEIMPPKSTWFEPKLLSGLFLHDLETK